LSNQVGAGQIVSAEVQKQSNPNAPVLGNPQPTNAPAPATPTTGAVPSAITSTRPTIDLQKVYDTAYTTPEIQSANQAVTQADQNLVAKQKEYNDAVALINDNPFYSEATMNGKVAQLDKKYQADVANLQNAKSLAADSLAKLKADAEIKVNLSMKQYDIDNQAYKDQLSIFNSLLDSGGMLNASGTDIASYAVALGVPTSMIESVIQKQKNDQIKPQLVTQTDDNGNVTVASIDLNTGKVIGQTSLGTVGKPSGGTGGLGTKNVQSLKADVEKWMTLQELAQKYVGVIDQATVTSVYNAFHSKAGDPWGTAKESPQQINEMFGGMKGVSYSSLTAQEQSFIQSVKDQVKSGMLTREDAVSKYPLYSQYF
jgi:hypothetical protein